MTPDPHPRQATAVVGGRRTADGLLMGLLGGLVAVGTFALFWLAAPSVLHYSTWDIWFESDPPAAVRQMLDRLNFSHRRTSHHPLISIALYGPVRLLCSIGFSDTVAVGLFLAAVAAAWTVTFFAAARRLGLVAFDAVVMTVLASVTASVVFWYPVPESFALGALSLAFAVWVAASAGSAGQIGTSRLLAATVATLSFTSTNVSAGLALLVTTRPLTRAVLLAVASGMLVMGAWWAQSWIFPTAVSPLTLSTPAETNYVFNAEAGRLWQKAMVVVSHAIVMPDISVPYGFRLSVQRAWPGQGHVQTVAAAAIWAGLLMLGVAAAIRQRHRPAVRMLGLAIAAQVAVSLVFGVETFMYTAHVGPLLVMLAALACLSPWRRIARVLALLLIPLAGFANVRAFVAAVGFLDRTYAEEETFTRALATLTDEDQLIICGREAAAATGERSDRDGILGSPPVAVSSAADPDSCSFDFGDLAVRRQGWLIPYEVWSVDAIDQLRQRGARYFVTPYAWGIDQAGPLFDILDRRYRRVVRSPTLAVYDLAAPGS